jgi:hypothetical protein
MTELDPQRSALYTAARALAVTNGISFFDAVELLDNASELRELEADDGSAAVPWLDTREQSTVPRPWSDEDLQIARRRADAAGVEISDAAIVAGGELGVDAVGQLADAQRADRIAALKERSAGALENAHRREDERRTAVLADEMTSRSRQRVQAAEAAARRPQPHSSYSQNGR